MWQSQENMELTTSLETERHMAKELAAKLSEMGVELEESKQLVSGFRLDINKALVAVLLSLSTRTGYNWVTCSLKIFPVFISNDWMQFV